LIYKDFYKNVYFFEVFYKGTTNISIYIKKINIIMGLWKFLKGIFGANKVEDCGCDDQSCATPEVCEVEVPTVEVVETKAPIVEQAPVVETKLEVPAEVVTEKVETEKVEEKVTAKEIKAKSRTRKPRAKKEVKEVVAETEVKEEKKASKPRRRRKPKAKPENGYQA